MPSRRAPDGEKVITCLVGCVQGSAGMVEAPTLAAFPCPNHGKELSPGRTAVPAPHGLRHMHHYSLHMKQGPAGLPYACTLGHARHLVQAHLLHCSAASMHAVQDCCSSIQWCSLSIMQQKHAIALLVLAVRLSECCLHS